MVLEADCPGFQISKRRSESDLISNRLCKSEWPVVSLGLLPASKMKQTWKAMRKPAAGDSRLDRHPLCRLQLSKLQTTRDLWELIHSWQDNWIQQALQLLASHQPSKPGEVNGLNPGPARVSFLRLIGRFASMLNCTALHCFVETLVWITVGLPCHKLAELQAGGHSSHILAKRCEVSQNLASGKSCKQGQECHGALTSRPVCFMQILQIFKRIDQLLPHVSADQKVPTQKAYKRSGLHPPGLDHRSGRAPEGD